MKKFITVLICVMIVFLSIVPHSNAKTYGVRSTNQGQDGDILIHNNTKNRGTWTDSSTFKGDKGNTGKQGLKGDQGIQGKQGKGLKSRQELQFEAVIKSWKRTELSVYSIHDFNNNITSGGVKIKHYFGKSWTEKELDKINKKLIKLERRN